MRSNPPQHHPAFTRRNQWPSTARPGPRGNARVGPARLPAPFPRRLALHAGHYLHVSRRRACDTSRIPGLGGTPCASDAGSGPRPCSVRWGRGLAPRPPFNTLSSRGRVWVTGASPVTPCQCMNLLKNNLYALVLPVPGHFKTLGICSNFVGRGVVRPCVLGSRIWRVQASPP